MNEKVVLKNEEALRAHFANATKEDVIHELVRLINVAAPIVRRALLPGHGKDMERWAIEALFGGQTACDIVKLLTKEEQGVLIKDVAEVCQAVRVETIEECAKIAENFPASDAIEKLDPCCYCEGVAKAIRESK
jgi:hypothetical protein